MRFVIEFLNAQGIAPNEIHCHLCQQSFPADLPVFVAQNCHGEHAFQKIVGQVGAKATVTRTQSIVHGISIDNCGPSFLTPQEIPALLEAEMSVAQWFQSQAADFYDTGTQKLIPRYDKCFSSGCEYVEK